MASDSQNQLGGGFFTQPRSSHPTKRSRLA
jgi:hypothetical protein